MSQHDVDVPRPDGPPGGGPPPWINPEIQGRIEWRDGDIVISVPVKSGTTWTMNIVHQLREGGDRDFADVYAEVPWIEFVPGPRATVEELVARLDAMPNERRRAFKTHSPPPAVPYHAPGSGKDVKYVVVVRNPDEALVSLHPFIEAHSDALFDLWKIPREALVKPDFTTFFAEVANPGFVGMIFEFVASWWPLRHEPNVLFMHFSDMKRDHEGSVRKISDFLDFEPEPGQWPTILECTSFAWMKAHQEKFEAHTVGEVQVLNEGAMIRKGKVGAAKEDGMTEAISAKVAAIGREIVGDEAAFKWCYEGGPIPD
jgi:aryl sulfotransferase